GLHDAHHHRAQLDRAVVVVQLDVQLAAHLEGVQVADARVEEQARARQGARAEHVLALVAGDLDESVDGDALMLTLAHSAPAYYERRPKSDEVPVGLFDLFSGGSGGGLKRTVATANNNDAQSGAPPKCLQAAR